MPWHPQGAPLPIVFSLMPWGGRGRPYLLPLGVMPWGGHPQGAPLPIVFSLGVMPWGGHPQGAPLPLPCLLSALCPGEGTHKGRPYLLSALLSNCLLRVMPWGGRPQGAPLPIVFSRRYALGRAPTRGAPTNCSSYALGRAPTRGAPTYCLWRYEGTHKGRPYLVFSRRYALGRAPTRGAPLCGEGYQSLMPWGGRGAPTNMPWGGHPQGAPLPCLLSGVMPWGGHPQGAPLLVSPRGGRPQGAPLMPWGGHPQGAPLPIVFSPRYALGRAPTRGAPTTRFRGRAHAPTRFRQPQVVLSQFDAIALGKHQGIGVSEKHLRSPHSGWLFCLVAN